MTGSSPPKHEKNVSPSALAGEVGQGFPLTLVLLPCRGEEILDYFSRQIQS